MKRYEADDPQKLEDLTRTRAYGLLRAFIDASLARARADLELPSTPERTAELRGEIKGLRQALEAPTLVVREIREAAKRNQVAGGE